MEPSKKIKHGVAVLGAERWDVPIPRQLVDMVRYYTKAKHVRSTAQGHCFAESKPELQAFDGFSVDAAENLVEYTGRHVLSDYINMWVILNSIVIAGLIA